jgi:hypothetical protein
MIGSRASGTRNRHVERVFNPHHWGRRKLARDR